MIFLTAPKDLQQSPAYERILELLKERHAGGGEEEEEEVLPDRELSFESAKDYRRRWKEVYSPAQKLYVLAREDGTVGFGVYRQWRYLKGKGVPSEVFFEGGRSEGHEAFELAPLEDRGDEEDWSRYALVRML